MIQSGAVEKEWRSSNINCVEITRRQNNLWERSRCFGSEMRFCLCAGREGAAASTAYGGVFSLLFCSTLDNEDEMEDAFRIIGAQNIWRRRLLLYSFVRAGHMHARALLSPPALFQGDDFRNLISTASNPRQ
jgi:hypothetical protein